MSSVDDRIVNMQFNNKQFTAGVTESQRSLAGLDRTLASTGKAKGLEAMANSVDGVKKKFSVLQVAGVAAVATIASKATSVGLNFLKSFTLGPIMDGFREYNTNLQSVQTIMSNTGKSVGVVNKYLDELNQYSDQTIYNFSEMAKNIGTFTAAGVGLKDATASIKGIANLAALSGSNSQQASTAMYQLSQAISSGKVGLQDWNSVVNAGMGGKVFQTALARTGVNMGALNGDSIKLVGSMKKLTIEGGSFRESIQSKPGHNSWLTGEVLVETLKQISGGYTFAELRSKGYTKKAAGDIIKLSKTAFAAATNIKTLPQLLGVVKESLGSMWATAFRTILGGFIQSKKMWTAVAYQIIGPAGVLTRMGNGFNDLLKGWANQGGRKAVIEGFKNIFKSLSAIVGAFSGAWRDIFPATTSKNLVNVSKAFQKFTEYLVPSKNTVKDLRTIFAGLFATLHIGWVVIKAVAGAIGSFLGALFKGSGGATSGILDIAAALMKSRIVLDQWLSKGDKLINFMSKIGSIGGAFLQPLVKGISLVVQAFGSLLSGGGVEGFMSHFNLAKASFLDFIGGILKGVQIVVAPFDGLSAIVEKVRSKIAALANAFRGGSWLDSDNLAAKVKNLDLLPGTFGKVSGAASTAMGSVSTHFNSAKTSVEEAYKSMSGSGATAAAGGVGAVAMSAKAGGSLLENLGNILSKVGPGLKATFSAIGDAIGWVGRSFKGLFKDFTATDFAGLINAIFSGAMILQIKSFVKVLQDIAEVPSLKATVTETFGALKDTLGQMQKTLKAQMLKSIAIAVALLAASVIALSFIDPKDLAKSIGAIASLMTLLVGSMYALSKINSDFSIATMAGSMVLLGAAIMEIALAMTLLAHQDPKKLAKGLGFMAGGIAVLVAAMFAMSLVTGPIEGSAASILVLAIAMNILASAVLAFGLIPMDVLQQGLGGMAIGLALLTASVMLMSGVGPAVLAAGGAMVLMAVAMNLLVTAVIAFGLIPMDVLTQGMTAMAIGIGIFTLSLMLLAGAGPAVLAAGAAMVMMAVALNIMMTVLLALGAAPWEVVKQGLIAVALALGILLVAGALAMVVAPGLMALAIVIGAIGAAMALAGVGMLAFGTGFAIFAAAGVAGVAIITAAFHLFLLMLPTLAVQLAISLVAFLKAIANAAPKIRQSLGVIIKQMLGVVKDAIPQLGAVFQTLLNTAIKIIKNTVPRFIEAAFTIIDAFLKSAEQHVPKIADSALKLVTKFLTVLGNNVGKMADAGAKLIVKTINGIADAIDNNIADLRAAGLHIATSIIDGLTGGLLSSGMAAVRNAATQVANSLPAWMRKVLGIHSPSRVMKPIGHAIGTGMAVGITSSIGVAVAAAVKMANAIIAAGSAAVAVVQGQASVAQGGAFAAQAKADIDAQNAKLAAQAAARAKKAASKAPKKNKKAATARANHAQAVANAKQSVADSQKAAADRAQAAADAAAKRVQDLQTFLAADNEGKGKIKSDAAIGLATQAQQMLARANAQAAEAVKLAKTNKAAALQMQAEAKKSAAAAANFAKWAQASQQEALSYYAKARVEAADAVRQRIADIKAEQKAEADARAAEEAYNAADAKGKADIMNARAAANEAKAALANAAAANAMSQAEALAASSPEEAMKLVDFAEAKAQEAAKAADDAKQQRDQAVQDATGGAASSGSSTGTSGGGDTISPSRTALEDAARAVDRYTASLNQAEAAAASSQSVVQFYQTNTSPIALSASEIYRQSKNLLSAQEVKMGVRT